MSEVHGQQHYQVLKHKYIGLGKENTTQEEWTENIHRDTYNSLQGHAGLLEYLTLAQNSPSKRQVRIELIKKMGQTKLRSREE
ncbi:YSF3 (YNL138W-A) [Zygosaccharomyces parabailii]|uniref:ZYBA0S16-01112g1_1 n=1 Tax=Zygosaccharomyces bailii (strain CLIB 213 / ATCC 58445 / CBS 680 / BCRC 21525 / NBRC 1098 / NCYC 1416 / NRRL Y-2227) TaxID=1333698 RepID=A0A8J2TBI3_ZYGB2|nr:YSF3 (YNL138W-A) [Zygosaccharomyces parabailii]CDF91967.1 ZYBA0S16-01112g1_1 [Zygosaccharomyces bailii CLIB 213]